MNENKTIDLNSARTSKDAKVFSGRERGKYWRQKFRLDELDCGDSHVVVLVPEDILSINLSFFLSLFGESVRYLGPDEFRQKYGFNCDPSLRPLIEQGIEQALKKSNVLLTFA
jgi:hypothetical protein